MLNELQDLQDEGDENVWHTDISVTIETRSESDNELIHKEYTFSHAPEFEKWTFSEYKERRTPDTRMMTDRNWRQTRHIMWHEVNETPEIDVPKEVADAVAEATGAEEVVLQVPVGSVNDLQYDEVYHAAE